MSQSTQLARAITNVIKDAITDGSKDGIKHRGGASTGPLRVLPWVVFCLGVLAPLMLVVAAALGSDAAAVRAQMIVQGCELLVMGLAGAVILGVLARAGSAGRPANATPRAPILGPITTA